MTGHKNVVNEDIRSCSFQRVTETECAACIVCKDKGGTEASCHVCLKPKPAHKSPALSTAL